MDMGMDMATDMAMGMATVTTVKKKEKASLQDFSTFDLFINLRLAIIFRFIYLSSNSIRNKTAPTAI